MRSFKILWYVVGPNIDTHTQAQCSHASVGLAQAHPNYNLQCCVPLYVLLQEFATIFIAIGVDTSLINDKFISDLLFLLF